MHFVDVTYSQKGLKIIDKDSILTLPYLKGSFIDICNNNINFWSTEIDRNSDTSHIWLNICAKHENPNIVIRNFPFLSDASVSHELIQGTNKPRYYTPDFDYSTLNNNYLTISNVTIMKDDVEYVTSKVYEFNLDEEIIFEWSLIDYIEELGFTLESAEVHRGPTGLFNMRDDHFVCNAISKIPKNNLNDERFKEGNYLVSERKDGFIFVIDKDTKHIVWYINGKELNYHSSHYPHMIPLGLEGAGNILFYNNGLMTTETSSIIEFNPLTKDIVFEYESKEIKSAFRGSVQKTIDGTYLICASEKGNLVEVDKDKNIINIILLADEEYLSETQATRWNQANINRNVLNYYRAERIPYEWIDKIIPMYSFLNEEKIFEQIHMNNFSKQEKDTTTIKY